MLIRHFSSLLCFPDLDSYHRIFNEGVRTVSTDILADGME